MLRGFESHPLRSMFNILSPLFLYQIEIHYICEFFLYWQKLSIETKSQIIGGFLATFGGVYLSLYLNGRQQMELKKNEKREVFLSTMEILVMELAFNESIIKGLSDGLKQVPRVQATIYGNLKFLLEHSNDTRSMVFNNTISSGIVTELQNHEDLFNALHHSYYNMESIGLSLVVLALEDAESQEQSVIDGLINKSSEKVEKVLQNIRNAKKLVQEELEKNNISIS